MLGELKGVCSLVVTALCARISDTRKNRDEWENLSEKKLNHILNGLVRERAESKYPLSGHSVDTLFR